MNTEIERQVEFTKTFLVSKIIEQNEDLRDVKLIKAEAKSNDHLNGFMSNIINLTLSFESQNKE